MQNGVRAHLQGGPKSYFVFFSVYTPCFHIELFRSHIGNKNNKRTAQTPLAALVLF